MSSTGLIANPDGSAAVQVGGSDYIQIAANGNVTIPQSQTVSGNQTVGGTLAVGSNQTVGGDLTVTGNLTVSGNPSQLPIGQGQTWQNVKASRVAGTTYTNTTGRTIVVQVGWLASTAAVSYVDGLVNGEMGGGTNVRAQTTFIVPAGSTYNFGTPATVDYWVELR